IGSCPFRLQQWTPGTGVLARAFTDCVLGPPRVATLDIRFIADGNTILANLLAGSADVSTFPWVNPNLAVSVRDQWVGSGAGAIIVSLSRLQYGVLQFRDVPNWEPAIADVRFRKALLYGLDREGV